MTFEAVRKIALSLDNVEEGTSYGTPAFKVRGKLFARLHQDSESLVVRMDRDNRAELMTADPETYYITDHYLKFFVGHGGPRRRTRNAHPTVD